MEPRPERGSARAMLRVRAITVRLMWRESEGSATSMRGLPAEISGYRHIPRLGGTEVRTCLETGGPRGPPLPTGQDLVTGRRMPYVPRTRTNASLRLLASPETRLSAHETKPTDPPSALTVGLNEAPSEFPPVRFTVIRIVTFRYMSLRKMSNRSLLSPTTRSEAPDRNAT